MVESVGDGCYVPTGVVVEFSDVIKRICNGGQLVESWLVEHRGDGCGGGSGELSEARYIARRIISVFSSPAEWIDHGENKICSRFSLIGARLFFRGFSSRSFC